ncbi:MAG: hypothetical protein NVS4B3_00720 [Gemmatimonadaceae bacterium]
MGPLPALVKVADEAWDAGRHAEARRGYAAVVALDTTAVLRAVFRLAKLHAWAGHYEEALTLYAAYRRLAPDDSDGRIGVAQTLSWAGRFVEAERAYADLADLNPPESVKGRARLAAWRGDIALSEALWREATERFPDDAEGWVGLARALSARGRPVQADKALGRALDAQPEDVEARNLRELLAPELRANVEPMVTWAEDSDDNRATAFATTATLPPLDVVRVRVLASQRAAQTGRATGASTSGGVAVRFRPTATTDLHASIGASQLRARVQTRAVPSRAVATGGLHVVVRATPRAAIGGGISRDVVDETAPLIAAGIVSTSANVEGKVVLPPGVMTAFTVEHSALQGATPNRRWSAAAAVRQRARLGLTVGLASRAFGFEKKTTDGYFAPHRFVLIEATVHGAWGDGRGWFTDTEGGVGRQTIDLGAGGVARGAMRLALSAGYRTARGRELVARWAYANAAGGVAVADAAGYEARLLTLRALLTAW